MSEAQALGAKRKLQEAVLGHSSGAKAESLYHQCSTATMEAVDEPELNVWYRKDPLGKEAPKRAPEVERDAEGYPVEARRRLEILEDGTVRDLDTRQRFKQKKTKEGVRLVPIFSQKRMKWKSQAGFEAVKLLLDCLGEKGQYTLVVDKQTKAPMTLEQWRGTCIGKEFRPFIFCGKCDQTSSSTTIHGVHQGQGVGCGCVAHMNVWADNYNKFMTMVEKDNMCLVTTKDEWKSQCTTAFFKPAIRCLVCGDTCSESTIANIQQGQRIGCSCAVRLQLWVHEYDKFRKMLEQDNMHLVTTRDEWKAQCTGNEFKPTMQCTVCKETNTARIGQIQQGHRINCACLAQPWVCRFDEFETILESRDLKLLTTREEWTANCSNERFKPLIECKLCGQVSDATTVTMIQRGSGIDCACRNKTEGWFLKWLQKHFSDVRHNKLKLKNPKTDRNMSVDFDVPSRMLAFELDGLQHFDPSVFPGGNFDGPKRDLEKEKQLLGKGYQLIRVLQDDVYRNKNGWENYLLKEIERWRLRHDQGLPAEPARCPDAPEYLGGIYAKLRAATV
jgi:very-short-patch-repair endonuclease